MNRSPLLIAAYEKAKNDPVAIADGFLACLRNEDRARQEVFAVAIGELIANLNAFLRGPKN